MKSKCYARYIFLLILLSGAFKVAYAQIPEGLEENFYKVYYGGFQVDYIIYSDTAYFYLPLTSLLADLVIYNEYDASKNKITGYVSSPKNAFNIDFLWRKGAFLEKTYTIEESQYFTFGGTIYCRIDLIEKALGFRIFPNVRMLYMSISSDIELPLLKLNKKYQIDRQDEYMNGDKFYKQYNQSKWSLLNGGMMDWQLALNSYDNKRNYAFAGNLGLKALGGDVFVRGLYNYNEYLKVATKDYEWRWRYFLGENKYLTQISIGKLLNTNYRATLSHTGYILEGVQISNEEFQRFRLFDDYVIEDRIEADWQVELFKNGELIAQMKTDSLGKYWFKVPIYYGPNRFELKIYGPKGQFISKQWNKDVTYEMLRPGEIKYTIDYGNIYKQKYQAGEAKISLGMASYMSNNLIMTKKFGLTNAKPDIINQLLIAPFPSSLIKLEYYHEHLSLLSLRYISNNYTQTELTHTVYDSRFVRGAKFRTTLFTSVPRLFGANLGFHVRADRTAASHTASNFLSTGFYWTVFPFTISGNYNISATESEKQINLGSSKIYMNVLYTLYSTKSFLKIFDNTRIGVQGAWSSDIKKLSDVGFFLSQPISHMSNYSANFGYNPISSQYTASLQLNVNLPYARTQTGAFISSMSESYNQSLNGSFGFDSQNWELVTSAQSAGSMAGYGAANVRFYLDNNSNEVYDSGDETIPNVGFYVSNEGGLRYQDGDITRMVNMNPYVRCNFRVDKNSFQNPNWGPKLNEFSFTTDPNIFQSFDIPCYTGGVIEGSAQYQIKADSSVGQGGLRLRLKNVKSDEIEMLEVFDDGAFYKLGIAPGDYELSVDETQLKILSVKSDPIYFTVKNSIDGDYLSGLTLKLYPAEKTPQSIEEIKK